MYLFHHSNWTIRIQYRFRPKSFLCLSSMSVRAGVVSSASPKLSQTSKIIHQWSHISVINNSDNKYAANAFDTRSDYDHFNCQKFPWINFFSSLGLNQILPWLPYKLHWHCKKKSTIEYEEDRKITNKDIGKNRYKIQGNEQGAVARFWSCDYFFQ